MSTHEEQRISKLLDYPYGSFLMIRLEYMLICGDELEAKILRLIEIDMNTKRRALYQEYMDNLPKGSVPTDQVIDITRDVWVPISYRTFTYDLYNTVKSDNTLKRAIKSLVDKGLLSKRYAPAKQYDAPEYQINTTKVQEEFGKLKASGKSGYQKLIPSKSDTIKNSPPQELIPSGYQILIPSGDFRVSNFDTNSRIENTVDITVESNRESGDSNEITTPISLTQEEIALILSLRQSHHQGSEYAPEIVHAPSFSTDRSQGVSDVNIPANHSNHYAMSPVSTSGTVTGGDLQLRNDDHLLSVLEDARLPGRQDMGRTQEEIAHDPPRSPGESHHSQQESNAHQNSVFSPPLPGENAPDVLNASIGSSSPSQAVSASPQREIEPMSTSKQPSYSREKPNETPETPTSRQKPRARKPPVEKPAPPAQPDLSQLSEQEQQVYAMLRAEDKPKYLAYSPAKREVYNNWLGSYGFAVSVDITPKFDECLNRAIHIHPSAEDFKNWRATLKKQDNEKLPEKRYFKNRNPQIWDVMRDIASLREMMDTATQNPAKNTSSPKASMTKDQACKLAHDIMEQARQHSYTVQAQAVSSAKVEGAWVVHVKWEGAYVPVIKSAEQWQKKFQENHDILQFDAQFDKKMEGVR